MMSNEDYKIKVVSLIDDYLQGKVSREAAWQWAQEVMLSADYKQLPIDLQGAIHGIWVLHDEEGSWVPSNEELRQIRNDLAK